ncbi:rhodanese-like domain-containing protein [Saprospira sp. CCB-QB6]|uniref:rhodanese-like domain-containing protein n=1 Tax=Saprospira sp. CCB-QB6 TaxID=3023936 RepID=UPI00234BC156|nr:rhodanese-like domain-containing protein [Saprospira sp. CCB-QB6]WCL81049.1 rhodanese-like domain-containing protein [Saprospira sp. CCB-QB6]
MKYLSLFAAALLFLSCNAQEAKKVQEPSKTAVTEGQVATAQPITKNIAVADFKAALESAGPNLQLVDVRTPGEWAEGTLQNAQKINWNDAAFDQNIQALDKTQAVYVYCRSGARSSRAMARMQSLGFTEVYNLNGGIMAWQNAGYEVVK